MDKEARLLQTKLFVPKVSENLIHRSHLTRIIEDGTTSRIVLISAPAGFGKTSLLADWIQEYRRQPAWLTLDIHDNDPTRFIGYLTRAFSSLPASVLSKLISDSQTLFTGNHQQQIEVLINCIFDSGEKTVLILDDFHQIQSPVILNLASFFIENLPANASVMLLTRCDPPLNLANWRARGYLTEIRQADLGFTDSEAAAYLKQIAPFEISHNSIETLNHKVEGWPAGLHLAVTALLRQKDQAGAERFIDSFKGTNRYILEYLMEEVLSNQTHEIRNFLLLTSLFDSFCAPLCDYALEIENSQFLLDYLDRNNLFVIALDNQGKWYRYHRLFTDLLESQIDLAGKEKAFHVHQRAAEWLERNGHDSEAIEHCFRARDDANAARLIQSQAKWLLNRGEFYTLSSLVKRLPEDLLKANSQLCAYYALALIIEARPFNEISGILEIMEQKSADGQIDHAFVQAMVSILRGDYEESARAIQTIRKNPPKGDELLMSWLEVAQMIIFEDDLQEMHNQLANLANRAAANGNLTIAITSLCFSGDLLRYQGKLHAAKQIYENALALAALGEGRFIPAASVPFLGIGEVLHKWNRLEEAERSFKKSLELSDDWKIKNFFSSLTSLARTQIALGKHAEANALMKRAEQLAQQFDITELDDFVVACRIIQLKIIMGDTRELSQLESRLAEPVFQPRQWPKDTLLFKFALVQEIQELTQAWVLLYKDRLSQVIPLLTELLDRALTSRMCDYAIQYAVLLAVAYHKNRNREKALENIALALHMSKEEGQVRVFLDQGVEIIDLLYDALQNEIEPDFTGMILALFPQMEKSGRQDDLIHFNEEIIEPLTVRETEILNKIAKGFSNREIASAMHLSLATVKVHAYNIFRKLNVGSRTQAVSKARLINIIA